MTAVWLAARIWHAGTARTGRPGRRPAEDRQIPPAQRCASPANSAHRGRSCPAREEARAGLTDAGQARYRQIRGALVHPGRKRIAGRVPLLCSSVHKMANGPFRARAAGGRSGAPRGRYRASLPTRTRRLGGCRPVRSRTPCACLPEPRGDSLSGLAARTDPARRSSAISDDDWAERTRHLSSRSSMMAAS